MPDKRLHSPQQPAVGRRAMLGWIAMAGTGGLAASLEACTARSPRTSSTVPRNALNVRHFGARGDGRTDDTRAIATALKALRPGRTLVFPRGTYRHTQVLTVATPGVTLQGPGRLYATAEQTSALRIDAPEVTVQDMRVAMGPTTQRWSSDDQHKIFLAPHPGISVRNVHIEGSAAAGLFCYGAHHFRFSHVRVSDTRADGVHMTNGSHHGTVHRPTVMRSGDDGVAVVSYLQDPAPCHDIVVTSPHVETTTGGRGVSVVGGHDVAYHNVRISHSNAASVYIACEGGDFVTRDTERVTVHGGTITNANTNAAIDHGAVLVYCGRAGGSVDDVLISGLTVSGTRLGASRQIGAVADGSDDKMTGIVFQDLHLAAQPPPYQGDAPTSDVRIAGVQAAGEIVTTTP